MMQAELEAEVWRNVDEIRHLGRPLIEQGSVVAQFGPGEHELHFLGLGRQPVLDQVCVFRTVLDK